MKFLAAATIAVWIVNDVFCEAPNSNRYLEKDRQGQLFGFGLLNPGKTGDQGVGAVDPRQLADLFMHKLGDDLGIRTEQITRQDHFYQKVHIPVDGMDLSDFLKLIELLNELKLFLVPRPYFASVLLYSL